MALKKTLTSWSESIKKTLTERPYRNSLLLFAFSLILIIIADIIYSLTPMMFGGYFMQKPLLYELMINAALLAPILWGRFGKVYAPIATVTILLLTVGNICNFCLTQVWLSGDIFGVLSATSYPELVEFAQVLIRNIGWIILISILFTATVFILYLWALFRLKCRSNMVLFILSLVAMLPLGWFLFNQPTTLLWRKFLISRIVYNYCEYMEKNVTLIEAVKQPKLPKNISFYGEEKDFLGVVVIGESFAKNHFSLYNYPRKTTPNMDSHQDKMAVFTDVISSASGTIGSLSPAFTDMVKNGDSVNFTAFDVLNQAGFNTVLLSNQYRFGEFDGVLSTLFMGIKEKIYLCDETAYNYDGALLKHFDEALKKRAPRTIIFLHLMGAHSNYDNRYPQEFAIFKNAQLPDKLQNITSKDPSRNDIINSYDNAIYYSDYVFEEIRKRFAAANTTGFMIYFSDHGQTLDTVYPNASNPEAFEVPFVVLFSDLYIQKYPETVKNVYRNTSEPWQTDDFIYALLNISKVNFDNFPKEKNIFSEEFKPKKRFIDETHLYTPQK